jgi:hypothetical protein
MMALELLDTNRAGVIQPDPDSAQAGEVETEHIPARPTDRAGPSFRLRVNTGSSSCEPESRSPDGPLATSPHRFPMDVRTCPVDECVEIQLKSLHVPPGAGHRDVGSQRSAACEARPREVFR